MHDVESIKKTKKNFHVKIIFTQGKHLRYSLQILIPWKPLAQLAYPTQNQHKL